MGLDVAQITSQDRLRACFDAVTGNAVNILQLDGNDIAPGPRAFFVLLQARNPIEASRLRLKMYRAWKLVPETPAATAVLRLSARPASAE